MTSVSVHEVTEIKSRIEHYTENIDFYVRELTIKTSDDEKVILRLFSDDRNNLLLDNTSK